MLSFCPRYFLSNVVLVILVIFGLFSRVSNCSFASSLSLCDELIHLLDLRHEVFLSLIALQFESGSEQVVFEGEWFVPEDELSRFLERAEFLLSGEASHLISDLFLKISVLT